MTRRRRSRAADRDARRARPRRRRSRRSPTTRSCRTATPARWSRPTAAIDWLCVPRFDSPSVFGTLLDREAGLLPARAVRHQRPDRAPVRARARTCSSRPGRRRRGWVVVRDALTMGPRRGEDTITPHTRPPADDDADHLLVRTVECLEGSVEIELVCEPVFDYGREPARVDARRRRPPRRRRHRRRPDDPAADRPGARHRGRPRPRAARRCSEGEQLYCALSWAEGAAPRRPTSTRPRHGSTRRRASGARWLGRARIARPPLARADPALGADDQGPHLHADRRDGRGAHDVAARDAGRRAQLGLPLHVDARLDVHAAGAALPQPRLGGRRVHAVRRRPRAERGRRAADHVRHRRPARPDRVDARRPLGLRRRAARCGSATAPSTSARTTSSARCSTRSCCTRGAAQRLPRRLWPIVQAQAECATRVWREPDQGIWEARGDAAALRVVEAHVLGRARPRGEARRDPRRPRAAGDVARRPPTRSAPTSSSTA